MRIKKNDKVLVKSGKSRGVKSEVISVNREENLVTVKGVNEVQRHVKRSQKNMQGGRISKLMPISASNVAVICPKCQQPSKIGYSINENGKKVRVCKKCKAVIDIEK
ncbi:MAG: 50S ribosomal protein L24 [Planctomycetia bacterium]|nr:50S ribosomal protein L24 [Planctomycetia bacterium]